MQIASWLLVQRAVAEGEITPDQARAEKNRVKISDPSAPTAPDAIEQLPERLRSLMDASHRMQARVLHLENLVMAETEAVELQVPANNGVNMQIDRLRAAFAIGR
jgi:regulator of CtrA degradation